MDKIFISYATKDKFFAELLSIKLEEKGLSVWRDVAEIRPGEEWRDSIDRGIRECAALVLVLSQASVASHYVTYEWATASAIGKTIIPIYLEECARHPKIEPIQYMDFRTHNTQSWDALGQRIVEIVNQAEQPATPELSLKTAETQLSAKEEKARSEIKAYLNRKGSKVVSFAVIRSNIDRDLKDDFLAALVEKVEEFVPANVHYKAAGRRISTRAGLRLQ